MKKHIITSSLILALSSPVALAEEQDIKNAQNIGLGSGFVLGALAGGPLGAMIGAVSGIFVGHSVAADKEMTEMETALARNEAEINQLLASNQQLLTRLRSSEQQMQLQTVSAHDDELATDKGLSMNVQFRSGSSELESIYQQQLSELAQAVKRNKALRIELSGHADRRGDEHSNQQLSLERINAVRQLLTRQGIGEGRISARAHGEAMPLDRAPSLDGDAFDRRVSIRLTNEGPQTAQNQ
ncbi:sortase-associated OmpA-like protein PdsO [Bowmanella dokdonensis]|uniref:Sortase-associated OmpA-like protein PdsO n=1 Tax=Bowmanella dokdonensis TaxID=751969 RepID=A0A939IS23_9ALTE|nr:sortase-associated OmpA-like protein PdsO [Bowmanella dokdonensis]MBN7825991.1 sortase-associated OmpA-like protein PdsO [Bowmanella dokdonensis]